MGLIKCPNCGKSTSDQAPTCPNCGKPIFGNGEKEKAVDKNFFPGTPEPQQKISTKMGCVMIFFVIAIIGWIMSLFDKPAPPPPPPPPPPPKTEPVPTTTETNTEMNGIVKANAVLAYMEQETQWKMKDHETLFRGDTAWAVRGTYYNGSTPMVTITVPFGAEQAIIKDLATQEEKIVPIK